MNQPVWYCLGFAFDHTNRVLLLNKHPRRGPPSVRGRLNGLGGKVRAEESVAAAMVREFQEESGIATEPEEWRVVARLRFASSGAVVVVFATRLLSFTDSRPAEEGLVIIDVNTISERVNLAPCVDWLVPLCLDGDIAGGDLTVSLPSPWEIR